MLSDHSFSILYLQQPLVVFFWVVFLDRKLQTSQDLSQAFLKLHDQRKVDDEAPAVFLPSPIKDSGYDNQKTQGADGRPHHFQHLGR